MNPVKTKANPYVAAFHQATSFRNDEPAWLREVREASFSRFNEVGFPTVNEEEWKYIIDPNYRKTTSECVKEPRFRRHTEGSVTQPSQGMDHE